ncbi:hypothetical protein UlMin_028698 [Ulmus minor]
MLGCKSIPTPLVCNEKLMKEDGENKVDETLYRSLEGNLLYLTAIGPNITFATSLLSRFMNNPSQKHFGVGKRVFNMGGSVDDMKSTSRYVFSPGSSVFLWLSKKQKSVAQSLAEAEYMSASIATSQVIWLKIILKDFGENQEAIELFCDNKSFRLGFILEAKLL